MLWVGIGGAVGAIVRYVIGKWIASRTAAVFPVGTFLINAAGSFLLGIFAVLHLMKEISEWIWLLCGIGFLGASTTFSTFGFETIQLLQNGETSKAFLYVCMSVILGIVLAWMGGWLTGVFV